MDQEDAEIMGVAYDGDSTRELDRDLISGMKDAIVVNSDGVPGIFVKVDNPRARLLEKIAVMRSSRKRRKLDHDEKSSAISTVMGQEYRFVPLEFFSTEHGSELRFRPEALGLVQDESFGDSLTISEEGPDSHRSE